MISTNRISRLDIKTAFNQNKRLLDSIAYKLNKEDIDDARQIVYLTFLEFYKNYKPQKGKLSTWICSEVKHRASREINKIQNRLRLPQYITDIFRMLRKGYITGSLQEYRSLKKSGVHPFISIKEERFLQLVDKYNSSQGTMIDYCDEFIYNKMNNDNIYGQANSDLTEPEREADIELSHFKLKKLLNCLIERERFIIINYYGLFNNTPLTLDQLGWRLNVSRQAIQKAKITGLAKLHKLATKDNKHLSIRAMIRKYLEQLNESSNKERKEKYNG